MSMGVDLGEVDPRASTRLTFIQASSGLRMILIILLKLRLGFIKVIPLHSCVDFSLSVEKGGTRVGFQCPSFCLPPIES